MFNGSTTQLEILDEIRMERDPFMDVKNFNEMDFIRREMEHEAAVLYTETAYFSEKRPGPKAPNQTLSFVHSFIQTHIDNKIEVNPTNMPIFSSNIRNQQNHASLDQIIEEEVKFIEVNKVDEDKISEGFTRKANLPSSILYEQDIPSRH